MGCIACGSRISQCARKAVHGHAHGHAHAHAEQRGVAPLAVQYQCIASVVSCQLGKGDEKMMSAYMY